MDDGRAAVQTRCATVLIALPEVFPDFAPGHFTCEPDLEGWVWTTFNEWQWDVNRASSEVLLEYAEIVLPSPTPESKYSGPTPTRSCGSDSARPARTSPRSTP